MYNFWWVKFWKYNPDAHCSHYPSCQSGIRSFIDLGLRIGKDYRKSALAVFQWYAKLRKFFNREIQSQLLFGLIEIYIYLYIFFLVFYSYFQQRDVIFLGNRIELFVDEDGSHF